MHEKNAQQPREALYNDPKTYNVLHKKKHYPEVLRNLGQKIYATKKTICKSIYEETYTFIYNIIL